MPRLTFTEIDCHTVAVDEQLGAAVDVEVGYDLRLALRFFRGLA